MSLIVHFQNWLGLNCSDLFFRMTNLLYFEIERDRRGLFTTVLHCLKTCRWGVEALAKAEVLNPDCPSSSPTMHNYACVGFSLDHFQLFVRMCIIMVWFYFIVTPTCTYIAFVLVKIVSFKNHAEGNFSTFYLPMHYHQL